MTKRPKPLPVSPPDPTNHKTGKGRPRRDIDWEQFQHLCELQCTKGEIASFLRVDLDTLITAAKIYYKNKDFSAIYNSFNDVGKCSLRRYQFNLAKTNANMAIWLGKQQLGQRDQFIEKEVPNQSLLKEIFDAVKKKDPSP